MGLAQAMENLSKLNVKLLVVGMGDTAPQQIPMYLTNGERAGWYQVHGETVSTGLEEDSLRPGCQSRWAVRAHGSFHDAANQLGNSDRRLARRAR